MSRVKNSEVGYNGQHALYQVALHLDDQKTRAREINALQQAMQELKISKGTIITVEHTETIQVESGIIEIRPAAYWALFQKTIC